MRDITDALALPQGQSQCERTQVVWYDSHRVADQVSSTDSEQAQMSATVQRRVGQRAVNVRERGQCLRCSDTDIGSVDSIESLSADESQNEVFSARSRDLSI